MRKIIFKSMRFGSRSLRKISSVLNNISSCFMPEDIQKTSVRQSTHYDMFYEPDELYYADQYWKIISPFLCDVKEKARCLDLGCCQGRFSLRLAKLFPEGEVLACDISEAAISSASHYANNSGVSNVEFIVENIENTLQFNDTEKYDVIMMTEVAFFFPNWHLQMPYIVKLLRPGGLFIASFRSQYYDALYLVRQRLLHNIDLLLGERTGRIFDTPVEYSWQTSDEINILLTRDYGLELLDMYGVGVCSGIHGDPHDHIVRPSQLDLVEQKHLMELELKLGHKLPDAGRYILTIARKPW